MEMATYDLIPEPGSRTLRIFSFDPALSAQYDTASIAEITIAIPWEKNLLPGPIGEYIEVIDIDPASGAFYKPIDLNDPRILAQDGLAPSEVNPQFHQQMVYAVAMATIGHFEKALGRVALWSVRRGSENAPGEFVRRLRIYPHALRDRNAFYSPSKKALLFGYFPVGIKDASNTPGTLVFTCLSHDIIAHETTHALLDGVHPHFNMPVNPDVLAFHEAFADIVALFQHFSYPGILRNQVARTRGNLANENLLGKLAQQFGSATGRGRALRDALGETDKATGEWKPKKPDVHALDHASEPHARGAILVAAIFGAFLKVYRARTSDLYRIASEGTGILREGEIHPDLARRLADEAARSAQQVLQMCIRAIDYCPPVGITFGDYLRAIVTADFDYAHDDPLGYRLAFVESFRQWGIHPAGMRSMSVESLLWPTGESASIEIGINKEDQTTDELDKELNKVHLIGHELAPYFELYKIIDIARNAGATARHLESIEAILDKLPEELNTLASKARPIKRDFIETTFRDFDPWTLDSDRFQIFEGARKNVPKIYRWLVYGKGRVLAPAFGLVLRDKDLPPTVVRPAGRSEPAVTVQTVRTATRHSLRGAPVTDLVVDILQRRRGYFDPQKQQEMDKRGNSEPEDNGDFQYYTGCTLHLNPATKEVRWVIRTPGTIADNEQLELMRHYLTDGGLEPGNAFDLVDKALHTREPFALVHNAVED
jgi:hypothetical protein